MELRLFNPSKDSGHASAAIEMNGIHKNTGIPLRPLRKTWRLCVKIQIKGKPQGRKAERKERNEVDASTAFVTAPLLLEQRSKIDNF